MDPQSIHLNDWERLLYGNAPVVFLVEVLIRALIIYIFLLVIIRLLGKRMSGQLTITEMAVMLTLGAIISVPMQMPERGILHGMLMLLFVLGFQRGITWFIFKSKKTEALTQGKMSMLIKDGELQVKELDKIRISKEQLFAILREEGIFQLGEVKRLYQEATGNFSIYRFDKPRPGYSIMPKIDKDLQPELQKNGDAGELACTRCGHVTSKEHQDSCRACGNSEWENAVIQK
ncbi:DUF421 domain-containing protein [Chitinophaga rhizophila]|uniref:DUF421 domain-containing protein n=1 Tax=Chitinophaga rhizophila TaxID=2866212 RepID=A0ABS7G5R5_9BACT|nr:YetF domain-containing protein [Chitinophaga rhizophila]MBW8682741.1 DUF421 domain-containing protein [Chitinophaga rhizophila]